MLAHVVPRGNTTLLATVPEGLRPLGASVPEVWTHLLRGPVRYVRAHAEEVVARVPEAAERYLG